MGNPNLSFQEILNLCIEETIKSLEAKLARKITELERAGLRSCDSMMFYETLDMTIFYAESPEAIENGLRQHLTACEKNLNHVKNNLQKRYSKGLGRSLSDAEVESLTALNSILDMDLLVMGWVNSK